MFETIAANLFRFFFKFQQKFCPPWLITCSNLIFNLSFSSYLWTDIWLIWIFSFEILRQGIFCLVIFCCFYFIWTTFSNCCFAKWNFFKTIQIEKFDKEIFSCSLFNKKKLWLSNIGTFQKKSGNPENARNGIECGTTHPPVNWKSISKNWTVVLIGKMCQNAKYWNISLFSAKREK